MLHHSGISESLPSHQQCYALVVQGSTAAHGRACSGHGLCYSNLCSSSEIFWSKKVLLPLAGLLGICHLFLPGVPRGGYNSMWVQGCWWGGPCSCPSSTGLHGVVGKWQPLLWPQILLSFLFLPACLFIQSLSFLDWYQFSPVHVFLFSPFCYKKCQALAARVSLVLPCCCMWIRVVVIDVFQHFFDFIFYCSLVNNWNRH